jgi:hypothetical protein
VECKRLRGLEPPAFRPSTEDNPLAPARDSRPTRSRTRTDEVGARHACRYTTGLCEADGPTCTGFSGVALRCSGSLSYVRMCSTPGWSRTSVLRLRTAALSPLSYGRVQSLRQESNLRFNRTKGACCRSHHRGEPLRRALRWRGARAPANEPLGLSRTGASRPGPPSQRWRRRESNPLLLGASEAPIPMGLIPGDADGWSRTTTARGGRVTAG